MDLKEFKKLCNGYSIKTPGGYLFSKEDNYLTSCGISCEWKTGGQGGGSCWDDGDATHYAIDGDSEPEFDELDKVLTDVCPNITFLQYKKLCNEVVHNYEYTSNEYYGNYTNYSVKWIDVEELYNYLKKEGIV